MSPANLTTVSDGSMSRHGEPSLDRDTVLEWVSIQRNDPAESKKILRIVLSHVTSARQIGEQIGVVEMALVENTPTDSVALKLYQRAEMDKRGRGGPQQQYVLHAFNESDAGGRAADCVYFWVRTQGAQHGDSNIDSLAATPETMLQQSYAIIRDLHELSIEERRAATEGQAAFYKTVVDLLKTEREEGKRLRDSVREMSESMEKTREALWRHENESKRTDAEVKMKGAVVGAVTQLVPAALSYMTGVDVRDHDNPSARQLYGFLKGLSDEKFMKVLEVLDDYERTNLLTWVKNHGAFEDKLKEDVAAKRAAHASETFPTAPSTAIAPAK